MKRVPQESSSIASIGYTPQDRVLELEFRQSGQVYRYFDVPADEYAAFLAADSKGTYLNRSSSRVVTATSGSSKQYSAQPTSVHLFLK